MIKYTSIFRLLLRCFLVARKDNLTGVSTGLTGRSKNLDPTGNRLAGRPDRCQSTRPVSISAPHTKPDRDCSWRVLSKKLNAKATWNRLYWKSHPNSGPPQNCSKQKIIRIKLQKSCSCISCTTITHLYNIDHHSNSVRTKYGFFLKPTAEFRILWNWFAQLNLL